LVFFVPLTVEIEMALIVAFVVSTGAACLGQQPQAADDHVLAGVFEHIVDGQARGRGAREGLHLDPGPARGFDRHRRRHGPGRLVQIELNRDRLDRYRMEFIFSSKKTNIITAFPLNLSVKSAIFTTISVK